jgi:hypothetical protein
MDLEENEVLYLYLLGGIQKTHETLKSPPSTGASSNTNLELFLETDLLCNVIALACLINKEI